MSMLDALNNLHFDIINESEQVGGKYKLTAKAVNHKTNDGDGFKVTFYENGKPIGHAYTCEYGGKANAFLYSFEVRKQYRGKGYGSQILKYMINKYDVSVLYVDKDNRAADLYKRYGFKQTGKFDDQFIIMKR